MSTISRPLDPAAQRLLELSAKAGYPPFESLRPEQARKAYAASWSVMQTPGGEVASAVDLQIPGPAGALAIRIYRGLGTDAVTPLPCLLFLHGGGWVIGNLESHDNLCRRLANESAVCIVAVDYRLAPEHPFPAALDDAAQTLRWIEAHAKELHIDPVRLAVGGDSAGGNLAAALALLSVKGEVPHIIHQTLIYPALDLTAQSESYRRITSGYALTASTMHYFINHYTPNRDDRLNWRASPLLAGSLSDLAPALVMTVSHDPLCDEGLAYAKRLDQAGVRVTSIHCNDQMHGLLTQGKMISASDVITSNICAILHHELHRSDINVPPQSFAK